MKIRKTSLKNQFPIAVCSGLRWFFLAFVMVALCASANAQTMNLDVTKPAKAGNVKLTVIDINNGTGIGPAGPVIIPIDPAVQDTAAKKAAKIATVAQAASVAAGPPTPFTITSAGAVVTIKNNQVNGRLSGTFDIGGTGEISDQLYWVAPNSGATFPGGHGDMNPHSPKSYSPTDINGDMSQFEAGVMLNGISYTALLTASQIDPNSGDASISSLEVESALFAALSLDLTGVSGVVLADDPTGNGISVDFAAASNVSGGFGIIFGTTANDVDASGNGYIGTLEVVPEPSNLALLALGLGFVIVARKFAFAR
jgi:hypothetical protein